ncbi:hypothetical protein XENTR_v10005538 [Xenopus tropicalis]|nr:hypothetical protein XENTR_v10005538 [Xenopus tropicalis]
MPLTTFINSMSGKCHFEKLLFLPSALALCTSKISHMRSDRCRKKIPFLSVVYSPLGPLSLPSNWVCNKLCSMLHTSLPPAPLYLLIGSVINYAQSSVLHSPSAPSELN